MSHRKIVLTLVFAVSSLLGDAQRNAAVAQITRSRSQSQSTFNVFLPAPRNLRQHLTRARKALSEKDYTRAVSELGALLASDELDARKGGDAQDFFIATPDDPNTRTSLKAEAHRMLGLMPERGRKLYELQFGAEARSLLNTALDTGSIRDVIRVSRRFFHTDAGYEANMLIGRYELDHGRPLAAALAFKRLADTPTAAQRFEPQLSLLLATSWLYAKIPNKASETMASLQRRLPQAETAIGDKKVKIFRSDVDTLAWLQEIVGRPLEMQAKDAEQWVMFRGNPMRTASTPGDLPLMNYRWRVPTTSHSDDEKIVRMLTKQYRDQGVSAIPSVHPLAVGNTVLMRTHNRLVAVDFRSGKRVWHYPWFDLPNTDVLQQSRTPRSQNLDRTRHNELKQRFWDDLPYGQLSSDGRSVFLLGNLGFSERTNDMIQRGLIMRTPGAPASSNQLIALDLETEGSLKWIVGGASGEDDAKLAGAFFLGVPLPLHGSLYALAEFNGEIRLVVIDSGTGRVQWTQQLADMENMTVRVDTARRLAGAIPSFSDGILVCPTSAGAIVAVDISNRSLLWGYQYKRPTVTRRGFAVPSTSATKGLGQRWADGTVTIANGHVIATPVEGDELICLGLLSGKPKWTKKRGDMLYVACVHGGNVVVVGNKRVTAYKLDSGETAWKQDIDIGENPVSGRGVYAKPHYILPTAANELIKIDLEKGAIAKRVKTQIALGNLVSFGDDILSQSGAELTTFLQVEPLRKRLKKAEQDGQQAEWTKKRKAELLLHDGKRAEALALLRDIYGKTPEDVEVRALLVTALLAALDDDFRTNRGVAAEASQLIDQPIERAKYLQLMAAGLHDSGDLPGAFDAYLELARIRPPSSSIESALPMIDGVEPHLNVRRDRWLRNKVTSLLEAATPEQREKMNERIAGLLGSASESTSFEELRSFVQHFSGHPLAVQAQLKLATRLIEAGESLEAEQLESQLLLGAVIDTNDPKLLPVATAQLAKLYLNTGRYDAARPLLVALSGKYAEFNISKDMTAKQWVDQVTTQKAVKDGLRGNLAWKDGAVTWKNAGNTRGGLSPYQNIVPVTVLSRSMVAEKFDYAMDTMTSQFVVRDSYGRLKYTVPLNSGRRYYSVNYNVSHVRAKGHIVLLSRGNEIVAIDLLRGSKPGQHGILWRKELFSQRVTPNRAIFNPIRSRSVQDPWGVQRFIRAADKDQNLIGQTSSLENGTVVYQHNRELICVELLTGKAVWNRNDVTPGCDLSSDSKHLFVLHPKNNHYEVFNITDGRKVGERDGKPGEKRWLTRGNKALFYKNTGSAIEMVVRNLEDGKPLWSRKLSSSSRGTLINDREFAYLEPNGKFYVVDWEQGKDNISNQIPTPKGVSSIYVMPSRSQYFLLTHYLSRRAGAGISAPSIGNHCVEVSGDVFAFDRKTGKPRWTAPVRLQGYGITLDQPEDVPVLAFVRQVSTRNGRSSNRKISYICLDKRDGRLIVPKGEFTGYLRDVQVMGNPKDQRATIRLTSRTIVVNFSDDPTPPAAPFQHSTAANSSVGVLGKQLGNLFKAIGGKKKEGAKKAAPQDAANPFGR